MNEYAIKTFYIKNKDKSRKITTYSKSEAGNILKSKHQNFVNKYSDKINFDFSYSYIQNKNTKKLMEKHIDSTYFLKVDIQNFFNSINHEILESKLIKELLINEAEAKEIIATSTLGTGVEVGLITSPLLSNIYLKEFDSNISNYLNENMIYTRYSDDILISSKNEFDYEKILKEITLNLIELKLSINTEKISYKVLRKKDDYIKFIGLNIVKGSNNNYLTVSRKFKKDTLNTKDYISKNAKLHYIKYNEIKNK